MLKLGPSSQSPQKRVLSDLTLLISASYSTSVGILLGTAANHRVELKRGLQFLEMWPVAREWRVRVGQAQGQALQNRQAAVSMSRPW